MKTIHELILDETIAKKFDEIKNVIGVQKKRSALYDINTVCNLKCNGCFYYSSKQNEVAEETDLRRIAAFIESEKAAGIAYAILIGGERMPHVDVDALVGEVARIDDLGLILYGRPIPAATEGHPLDLGEVTGREDLDRLMRFFSKP